MSGSKDKPWLPITLAIVLAAIAINSRPLRAEWLGEARPLLGTEVSVYLWHDDEVLGRQLVEDVFAEFVRIDELMSTYKDSSVISRVNREAASHPVAAGAELYSLVQRSLDISLLTRGAFDITYDSVGQFYDFRARKRPDDDTIARELERIDYRYVLMDDDAETIAFAEPGVRINLGGIAKGYAVECAVAILRAHGVRNAIVTAGGDTRLLGDRRGQPWIVGVRDPRREGEVAVRIPLQDEAVSTSGDYERYFDEEGVRYHHIIRPDTGRPADSVHSATIVGPDAVITDALSTSVFVMGVDAGLTLIGTLPDYEGIVIDAAGRLYYSDGLRPPGMPEDPD